MAQPGPSGTVQTEGILEGVENVVAVGAGKGGVGKSTAAVMLAVGLKRRGARVGLLDADVYGPSVPTLMGVADGELTGDAVQQKFVPVESHGIRIASIGFGLKPDDVVIWRGPMVHGAVRQFLTQVLWGELDYLIVDLPPGTGDVPLTLSQLIPLTGSVVVCTPQDLALADARRAVRMYERFNVPSLGIIENMSYYLCPKCGHRDEIFDCGGAEQAAGALGVPFLGAIPLNGTIRKFSDAGTPERNFTDSGEQVQAALESVVDSFVASIERRKAGGPQAPTISIE